MAGPVWFSQGEMHLPRGLAWLSPAELAYHDGVRFEKRRIEFLVARWTSKQALLLASGTDPAAGGEQALSGVEIGHAPDGAPVPRIDGIGWTRRMSSTDRAGWAVTVVSPDATEVGCDLELVEPRSTAFVADWFTPPEIEFVAAARDDDQRFLRANLVWSAKESALKVLRTGLRRDTRSVEVHCLDRVTDGTPGHDGTPGDDSGTLGGDGWHPLTVTTAEGEVFPGWWARFGDFVLTTAAAAALPAPVPLRHPPALAEAVPVHSWLASPRV